MPCASWQAVRCQNRVGSLPQGRFIERACRGFSKEKCDARFEEMAIGRVRLFQQSCERKEQRSSEIGVSPVNSNP